MEANAKQTEGEVGGGLWGLTEQATSERHLNR